MVRHKQSVPVRVDEKGRRVIKARCNSNYYSSSSSTSLPLATTPSSFRDDLSSFEFHHFSTYMNQNDDFCCFLSTTSVPLTEATNADVLHNSSNMVDDKIDTRSSNSPTSLTNSPFFSIITNTDVGSGIVVMESSSNNSSIIDEEEDSVDVVTVGDDDQPISMVVASSQCRANNMMATPSRPPEDDGDQSGSNTNKPKINCDTCGMTFRFPSKLRRHEKIHQPESEFPKEFPCDSCSKAFRYAYHLRRHKWLIHAPDRPIFTCDVCLKSYKGEELFRLHRAMAHLPPNSSNNPSDDLSNATGLVMDLPVTAVDAAAVEKKEPIEINNLASATTNNKQQQMFNCHVCGTSFKQKHYLTQHLMTHSKERPFICEVCQKGFARASTLFAHRYVHTVGRQFQCETCKKAFKHKRSLTEHIKSKICFLGESGSGGNNYFNNRSSTCSSTASADSGNNSNNTSQFVCEFCGVFFASVSYLFMHRRRCHRETLRKKTSQCGVSGQQQLSPAPIVKSAFNKVSSVVKPIAVTPPAQHHDSGTTSSSEISPQRVLIPFSAGCFLGPFSSS